MRILITGGAGFIGKHLSAHLMLSGHDIITVDRRSEQGVSGVQHHVLEITGPDDLLGVMQDVDMVYHLAANSNVRKSGEDAKDTLGTTEAVLGAMKVSGVKNIVFTSSSAAYGRSDRTLKETDALNPISEYGKAKAASEDLIRKAREHGIRGTILRLANVVGPGQSHGVVFDLFNKLKKDPKHLNIMGNGLQTKEYVHISDVLDAMSVLMDEEPGTYNISSGSPISVLEIADMLCSALHLDDVEYITEDNECGWEGDIPRYSLDTSKIRSTGWSPKHDSRSAVADAISFLMTE